MRVTIRPPQPADQAEFVALMRASRKTHRPWIYAPATPADFDKYLQKVASERNKGFLICSRQSGQIIGVINLNEIVWGALRSAYLGFYVGGPYAGQGLMTEGLGLVIHHAFTQMKLHRLEANIQPGNRRSLALVNRCGFIEEGFSPRYLKIGGRWRDHERWAILVEAWKAGRQRFSNTGDGK